MLTSPNVLETVGGVATVSVAVAAAPAPAFDETTLVVLTRVPSCAGALMTAVSEHPAPADNVAPDRDTVALPKPAVIVPLQEVTALITLIPPGRLSVKPIPVRAVD